MLRYSLLVLLILVSGTLTGCGGGNSGGGQQSLAERQSIAMNMSNPDARATELVKVAEAQFAAGDVAAANSCLAAAQAAVPEIEDNGTKAQTGIVIASALAKRGMELEAKDVLRDVRDAIETDSNPATKASSLGRMALVYGVSLENVSAAESYLEDATKLVGEIPQPIDRVEALLAIGAAYQRLGKAEQAETQFSAALDSARAAETPREQADLLVAIANRMQSVQLAEQAQPIREEARAATAQITEVFSRGYALVAVASSYQVAGDGATATALLTEADAVADKVSDSGIQSELRSAIQRAKGY